MARARGDFWAFAEPKLIRNTFEDFACENGLGGLAVEVFPVHHAITMTEEC